MMENKIPVVAYCRISTDSDDQKNSLVHQQQYFQNNVADGQELIHTYADEGITGTSFAKRPEFLRMVYDAGVDYTITNGTVHFTKSNREPKFKRILVTNLSRFSRDTMVKGCIRQLSEKGVFVDFLSEGKTTEDMSDSMLIDLLFLFSEQESKDKSIKILFGHRQGADSGNLVGVHSLYGYNYIQESNSLEIVPHEAEIVRQIFQWYSDGEGIRRIIGLLDAKGIKTRKGKSFTKSTISTMLSNEKFAGVLHRNKWDNGVVFRNKYAQRKPKDEWIPHENSDKIPAIISKELFEKCQQIKDGRSEGQRGVHKGHSKYTGLIKCNVCRANYVSNSDRGNKFYNCGTKKTHGTHKCNSVNVYVWEIEDAIQHLKNGRLAEILNADREHKIETLEQRKQQVYAKLDADNSGEIEQLQSELDVLNGKKERLLDLYTDGEMDKSILTNKMKQLDIQTDAIQSRIDELSMPITKIHQEVEYIDSLINRLKSVENKVYDTDESVIDEIDNITVFSINKWNRIPNIEFNFKTIQEYVDIFIDRNDDEPQDAEYMVTVYNYELNRRKRTNVRI